jgi:drug/metabolite transporter (DMT)-like permease
MSPTPKLSESVVVKPPFQSFWSQTLPLWFVLLWSTGFIGGRYGLPYAEPLTFLFWRMAIVTALLLAFAWATRAPWPRSVSEMRHIAIAGLLVHAGYLGGVFCALKNGMGVGLVALIVCLQPILTAIAARRLFGESMNAKQWLGLWLGLAGVGLVVASKIQLQQAPSALAVAQALLALVSITAGTLYQKRFCSGMDLRSGGVIQYSATGIVLGALAFGLETMHIDWTVQFMFALGWLCLVLSLGAISLLYVLIRRGAATKTASLFYLVPSVTAVMAFLLFHETLAPLAVAGLIVTTVGVALVIRKPSRA